MFDIFKYFELAAIIIFGIGFIFSLFMLFHFIHGYNKKLIIPHSDKKAKFAIIIPARDESKVIEANLTHIVKANYPVDLIDIYLILEKKNDPTIEISKKYPNTHIFFRTNLNNIGKGYALDECLKDIYTNNDIYDAFIILDADNVISKNFIERLNDAYQAGYDIACGKRDNKDWNASTVCGASALTFSIINTIQNKPKANLGMQVLLSGTGFFFRSSILRKYCGWPFHTLTEDYELTNYSIVNHLRSTYIDDAIYYDEQPLKLHQSIVQRTRWIKGYFKVRSMYDKQKVKALKEDKHKTSNSFAQVIGAIPMFVIAFDLIYYLLLLIVCLIISLFIERSTSLYYLYRLIATFGGLYILTVIFTAILFFLERKTIKIKKWNKFKVTLFHPIFLLTYINAAIRAIFTKSSWDRIDHTINTDISN